METLVRDSKPAGLQGSFVSPIVFAALRAPPRAHSFFMRQAPEGSPRGDRQTSGHDSISSAAAGRPESDDTVTATGSVGAEVWHGRKWSHEAKNGDAGCQKGRIDTQSRTHRSKNNTMCSHGTFGYLPPFSNRFYLVLRVVQRRQKQSPEAEIQHPGRHTGRVEDHKASGPWQHPSCCGRPEQER